MKDYENKIKFNKEKSLEYEFTLLKNSDSLIILFPYSISGIPSMVSIWFESLLNYSKYKNIDLNIENYYTSDKLENNTSPNNTYKLGSNNIVDLNLDNSKRIVLKKALLISIINFPESSFQPNSIHQSTVKRRIYHFLFGTLKTNNIIPLEPLLFYNFTSYGLKKTATKSSNNDSLSFNTNNNINNNENNENNAVISINKKVIDYIEPIELESQSNNATSLRNQSFLFNKRNKKSKETILKEEFISLVSIVLSNLNNYNKEVDITDI